MGRESIEERRARLMPGARWMRAERERRGWTGRQLAHRLDIAQERVSAYERAQDEPPPAIARRLAEVYGLPELQVWRALGLALPAEFSNDDQLIAELVRRNPEALRKALRRTLRSQVPTQDRGKPTRRTPKQKPVTRKGEDGSRPSQTEDPAV